MSITLSSSPIDPKCELFKWGPIAFKHFYGSPWFPAIWKRAPKIYPWSWPLCLGMYQNGRATFVLDDAALRRVARKFFTAYFLDRAQYRRHWSVWRAWVASWEKEKDTYSEKEVRKLSDRDLYTRFLHFYELNELFWTIAHVPEIANWGGEVMLREELIRIDPLHADAHLEVLSAPTQYSFFQREERDLVKIGILPRARRAKALQSHALGYDWLLNSYGGDRVLTTQYFAKRLHVLLRSGSAKQHLGALEQKQKIGIQRKKALARQLRLSPRILFMGEQLAQSIWWQDLRKGIQWEMNTIWDRLLRVAAARTEWTHEELLWCWPHEVLALISGKPVERRRILARSRSYAMVLYRGKIEELYGDAAARLHRMYVNPPVQQSMRAFTGLTVSKGNGNTIVGRAVVVQNPFVDGKNMRQGDILVAAMTSPEFIVVMKKASAIVTDHGGMTSHAAIVSRELGIPCIVGTKHATSVLKTGDKVEVDPTKGSIKKLC